MDKWNLERTKELEDLCSRKGCQSRRLEVKLRLAANNKVFPMKETTLFLIFNF